MHCMQERFLKDIANHEMQILVDEDTYRHLRFRKPGTICMGFDIVTWPGYLAISGDMGCYVFSRVADMFAFFRADRKKVDSGQIEINPGYWAEKVQAEDVHGGIKNFSLEVFRERVREWIEEREIEDDGLREAVEEELIERHFDFEHEAFDAAISFEHNGDHPFQDFWEVSIREYDYHYLWCCHAIVWAIAQYDRHAQGKFYNVQLGEPFDMGNRKENHDGSRTN